MEYTHAETPTMQPQMKPESNVASVTVEIPPANNQTQPDISIGKWNARFCGCFTHCVPNCCMVTFCPCVSMAQIMAKLNIASYPSALLVTLTLAVAQSVLGGFAVDEYDRPSSNSPYDGIGEKGVMFRLVSSIVSLLLVVIVWHLRSHTRMLFDLPGNACEDCLAALCCSCCAIAQIATHVKSYEPGSCDFGGPADTLAAYN